MWKDFVASGEKTAMFLEDDVYFVYDFEEKARSIFEKELPKDWDILYLSALPNKWGFTWDPHSENLSRLYYGVWWMSGYCLTRKAAQHLLNELPIVGPIDVWINYKFEGFDVLGEYFSADLGDAGDSEGYSLRVAYKFDKFEPVVRYSHLKNDLFAIDSDELIRRAPSDGASIIGGDNEIDSYYFGFNYYYNKAVSLMVGYEIAETDSNTGDEVEIDGLRARLQVLW